MEHFWQDVSYVFWYPELTTPARFKINAGKKTILENQSGPLHLLLHFTKNVNHLNMFMFTQLQRSLSTFKILEYLVTP